MHHHARISEDVYRPDPKHNHRDDNDRHRPVETAATLDNVPIGGIGGTVIVEKTMIGAGDLHMGKDLLMMRQLGVSGTIELGEQEMFEVRGREPVFAESTAIELTLHFPVEADFSAKCQTFSEGFEASCTTGKVMITEDLRVYGNLVFGGNLVVCNGVCLVHEKPM